MNEVIVRGAYGRQYETEAQVVEDWNEGKDFYTPFERTAYISVREHRKFIPGERVVFVGVQVPHVVLESGGPLAGI